MLTESPSISPLSYRSIRISPASVRILFSSAFSLILNTGGGGGKIFFTGFDTAGVSIRLETVAVAGCFTSAATGSFLTGVEATGFAATGFAATGFDASGFFFGVVVTTAGGCFFGAVVLLTAGTATGCLMHSRKVISSTAKSFPQPPGEWFIITSVKEVADGGVVNSTL